MGKDIKHKKPQIEHDDTASSPQTQSDATTTEASPKPRPLLEKKENKTVEGEESNSVAWIIFSIAAVLVAISFTMSPATIAHIAPSEQPPHESEDHTHEEQSQQQIQDTQDITRPASDTADSIEQPNEKEEPDGTEQSPCSAPSEDAADEAYFEEIEVESQERADEVEVSDNTEDDKESQSYRAYPSPSNIDQIVHEDGYFDVEIDLQDPADLDELQMWSGVRRGYVRKLVVQEGNKTRDFYMTTLSVDPPIFEIPNYLTDTECTFVKKQGIKYGLYPSESTYIDDLAHEEPTVVNDLVTDLSFEEADQLFRYSDQTWIPNDDLGPLISRTRTVLQLSRHVAAEQLQVLKYRKHGHYEAHTDSEAVEQGPCCDDPRVKDWGLNQGHSSGILEASARCRLCRFATVFYVLSDVQEGGGTVFPLADTTDSELDAWRQLHGAEKYKQTHHCTPGVATVPKKGKAILWYNHKIDRGYLGDLNIRSLHGGCNVYKGEKWAANHWFRFNPHPSIPPKRAVSFNRFGDYLP